MLTMETMCKLMHIIFRLKYLFKLFHFGIFSSRWNLIPKSVIRACVQLPVHGVMHVSKEIGILFINFQKHEHILQKLQRYQSTRPTNVPMRMQQPHINAKKKMKCVALQLYKLTCDVRPYYIYAKVVSAFCRVINFSRNMRRQCLCATTLVHSLYSLRSACSRFQHRDA